MTMHTSAVHWFPSSKTSASSLMATACPTPSQTTCAQSSACCPGVGLPAASNCTPHTPSVQVLTWQNVSTPGQSSGEPHWNPPVELSPLVLETPIPLDASFEAAPLPCVPSHGHRYH